MHHYHMCIAVVPNDDEATRSESDLQNDAAVVGPDGTGSTHVRQAGPERGAGQHQLAVSRPPPLPLPPTHHLAAVSCISTGWSLCIIRTKTCRSGSPATSTARGKDERDKRTHLSQTDGQKRFNFYFF